MQGEDGLYLAPQLMGMAMEQISYSPDSMLTQFTC